MQRRIKDSFSILLPAADAIRLFGERLNLSRITAVPQAHCRPCLTLNLSANSDSYTPIVNKTTDREAAPESMQSGRVFSRILQVVWEADPVQGLVQVLERDVTDAYHRGTIKPEQVGVFAYVIPSSQGEEETLSA